MPPVFHHLKVYSKQLMKDGDSVEGDKLDRLHSPLVVEYYLGLGQDRELVHLGI